ncbi:MAG TPA: hypothetical protein VF658_15310 [Pyrinomonadaceae bacterium]|jgi:hypothetical protein
MKVDERNDKDVAILMLRGVLGAIVGSALLSLLFLNSYYLLVAVYSLPLTAPLGAGVGVIIWWMHGKNKEELGPIARAFIGAFVFILVESLIAFLSFLSNRQSSSSSDSIMKLILLLAGIGVVVGGAAGIITGPQTISERESD